MGLHQPASAQGILTDKQMKAYNRYEQQMLGMIRMQINPYLKRDK